MKEEKQITLEVEEQFTEDEINNLQKAHDKLADSTADLKRVAKLKVDMQLEQLRPLYELSKQLAHSIINDPSTPAKERAEAEKEIENLFGTRDKLYEEVYNNLLKVKNEQVILLASILAKMRSINSKAL